MGTQLREHVRGSRADATTTAAAAAADAAANGPAAATAAARRTSDAAANGWWNATGNATRHATRNAIADSPNASDAACSYGPDRPGVPGELHKLWRIAAVQHAIASKHDPMFQLQSPHGRSASGLVQPRSDAANGTRRRSDPTHGEEAAQEA